MTDYVKEIGVGRRMRVLNAGPYQTGVRFDPPVPGFPAETVIANGALLCWDKLCPLSDECAEEGCIGLCSEQS